MVLAAGDPLHQLIEGGGDHHSTLLVIADILVRVWAFVPNVDGVWGEGRGISLPMTLNLVAPLLRYIPPCSCDQRQYTWTSVI